MLLKKLYLLLILAAIFSMGCQSNVKNTTDNYEWSEIKNTTKPWTRWWWLGNIVDKQNIRRTLVEFKDVGLGGVEITPIYGVTGEEDNFIDFLSPKWLELLDYTIKTADSLELGVDMVLGTGWPYGGPQVTKEDAATKLVTRKYQLKKGETIREKIIPANSKDQSTAELTHVLAYGQDGNYLDLTDQLRQDTLNWTAARMDYDLIAVFTGKTGQQVKRAAPGGQGFTVDHYSKQALDNYLARFDEALAGFDGRIRAVFNDSYEVYGTSYTPNFMTEFEARRGYDLKNQMHLLLSEEDQEEGNRVKSDFRETISDLLLENFNEPWTDWANSKGSKSRLQAHGSPGNLIDFYASSDIPECETFGSMPFDIVGLRREQEDIRAGDADPVMLKFSSSAGHIAGKPLISSESFTWLRDHFKTALSQCKPEAEDLMLSGVNHIFLHGATYSPDRADWPGWKFYASVNFNSTNTIWKDAPALFSYIANCQSMLQKGESDNETLLYWPIYDIWNQYLDGALCLQLPIHDLELWLHGTPFYKMATGLIKRGYGVDFISDDYIRMAKVEDGKLILPGGSFESLVVPNCESMPRNTLEKLISLKNQGANIIFESLPSTVPGFYNYEARNENLSSLAADLSTSSDVFASLNNSGIWPESLVETGLKYTRRDLNGEKIYYIVNHTNKTIADYIPLQTSAEVVVMYDPNNRNYGKADSKIESNTTLVKVNIASGESIILMTGQNENVVDWNYYSPLSDPVAIKGSWKLDFLEGGPALPTSIILPDLESWTQISTDGQNFSGTARYEIEFERPTDNAANWSLSLGDVRESAKVWINDQLIGTAWSNPFKLNIGILNEGKNKLTIEVTNLGANRLRAKEIRGEEWKIFHEINMVNKDYEKFDATIWKPMPSGLLGPITITPLEQIKI